MHDRLNVLMDVVMHMLSANGWSVYPRLLGTSNSALVLELRLVSRKTVFGLLMIAMLVFTVLLLGEVVRMLFGQDLPVVHRLHRGMVVVLVNFLVYGALVFLPVGGVDCLVGHIRSNTLVDGRIVMAVSLALRIVRTNEVLASVRLLTGCGQ